MQVCIRVGESALYAERVLMAETRVRLASGAVDGDAAAGGAARMEH